MMLQMENVLFIWIKDQHEKNLSVDIGMISAKALILYNRFKQQTPVPVAPQKPLSLPAKAGSRNSRGITHSVT
jgi:hypothetical protein